MKSIATNYRIDVYGSGSTVIPPKHDVQLVCVADGAASVTLNGQCVSLQKTDVFLANSGESCEVSVAEDSMIAVVSLDYYNLCDALETTSVSFYVNSAGDAGRKYTVLKESVQNLLMAHVRGGQDAYREKGCFYLLLHTLLTEFRTASRQGEGESAQRIIQYIHANFRSNISLGEIADRLYLSPSWVSRIFQKATGEHFASYLRRVRLDYARRALEESDVSVTQVASDSGFSTPSLFNRNFKDEFGVTPSEYRAQRAATRAAAQSGTEEKRRERLLNILSENQRLSIADLERQRIIHADAGQARAWKKWENRTLNVGPAHILTSAKMQQQVLRLSDRLDAEYLRIWNLFSPKLMICSENGRDYNFTFIDEIMDFCVDHRMKLFIDLAQRRDAAMASETREIYSTEERTPFHSAAAWMDALGKFLEHIRRRYHERVVGQWIFELTFFLNDKPYYADESYNVRTVWEQGRNLIRAHIPSAKIAGPGLVSNTSRAFMEASAGEFLASEHPPDIFTVMIFPYTHEPAASDSNIYTGRMKKLANRNFIQEQVQMIQEILAERGFPGKLWVTEWGCSIANRNFIQDSCFRASHIVENVLKTCDDVDEMSVFYASDLINAFADSNAVLSGSAGLLSWDGICKPAYYAWRFLRKLGRYLILKAENCVVTAESETDFRIICYNDKALGPRYYLSEENSYRPEQIRNLFSNTDPLSIELALNLPGDGDIYNVRQRILNERKGSVLDNWIGFGCSPNLSRSDMEYLNRVSTPGITMERMAAVDGQLRLSFRMEPNEIRLITITRE
ncbi:MAG: helix-turn-helix domain-containing protein [Oscillibacter sp.]|nr:helix-turn-helix domain-containing protein [Oscillibacter sp.]